MEISNLSIQAIVGRMMRILNELEKAVSTKKANFTSFDIERLKQYSAELKACKERETKVELDCPHYDRITVNVPEFPVIPLSENNSANDLVSLLRVMYHELVKSDSKDSVYGLGKFDSARFDALSGRFDELIVFIEKAEPNDYPEAAQDQAEGAA